MKWNKQCKEIDWCLALARIRVLPAFNVWGGGGPLESHRRLAPGGARASRKKMSVLPETRGSL